MMAPSEVKTKTYRNSVTLVVACSFAMLVSACGGGSSGGNPPVAETQNSASSNNILVGGNTDRDGIELVAEDCSVAGINQWIDDRMRADYIYYDSVPVVNLQDYTDHSELVRALRVAPDVYSSVVDQQRDEMTIANSTVPPRFGFWSGTASDGKRRFIDISGNSPMDNAGAMRGDALLAINGVVYEELTDEQYKAFIIGEEDEELTATFTIATGSEAPRDIQVTKASYVEKTVPSYSVVERDNARIGYLKLDSFRGTTSDELDIAVEYFINEGVTELVLDLRYNGGGYTRVARKFASQIAGEAFVGEVYSRRQYNDKNSDRNVEQYIEAQTLNLGLNRLVALTSNYTASASETLINGLAPFVDTVVVGVLTEGKPFTSVAQDYCGKRLNAMSTITTNGVGVSVLGGIAPTCTVEDEFLAASDSEADALTGAAFNYIQNSTCPLVQSSLPQVELPKQSELELQ